MTPIKEQKKQKLTVLSRAKNNRRICLNEKRFRYLIYINIHKHNIQEK